MLFNEPKLLKYTLVRQLQRAVSDVSVLFNEPKLLKYYADASRAAHNDSFSALQRAEIAEIFFENFIGAYAAEFQCSSTSRNC